MRISADQVIEIIEDAGFDLNPFARAYVGALHEAERLYGEDGVRTQILYILNNVRAKGLKQKEAKKLLLKLSKGYSP